MNKLPLFQKGRSDRIRFDNFYRIDRSILSSAITFSVFFIFFLLFLRLFQLTVVKGNYYYRLSQENRIKELIIEAPRGKIIDRKNLVIVKNLPADINKNLERLVSPRLYQIGAASASVVGYQQIADQRDLRNDHCLNKLKIGDKIGKKGVEKLYDCDLRGGSGRKMIEVDAKGKYLKTLTVEQPVEGKTIQLALDWQLQQKAYQLLEGKKGAVVAVKPKTGEILALVSSPTYNSQVFENGSVEAVKKIIADKDKSLFSRATAGAYPPGSIFKIVLAVAALEEKVIDDKTEFEDTGTIQAGPISFSNWYFLQYGKTEGMVNIVKAIQRSNDVFFYKTGEKLGPEKIKLWAEKLGYGNESGVGLEETAGLIPSPFWKEETLKDRWYTGDTYNLSIGQGYVLVTPLQVTMATAAIANNGYLCRPQLLKVQSCKKIPVSQKTLSLVQEGMKKACSPGGTGWPLFDFKVIVTGVAEEGLPTARITGITGGALAGGNPKQAPSQYKSIQTACKTGTAESQTKETAPHAWFTVYAPFENPEIVLTVLLEEAGQGSDIAGPIAKEILKSYFERKE